MVLFSLFPRFLWTMLIISFWTKAISTIPVLILPLALQLSQHFLCQKSLPQQSVGKRSTSIAFHILLPAANPRGSRVLRSSQSWSFHCNGQCLCGGCTVTLWTHPGILLSPWERKVFWHSFSRARSSCRLGCSDQLCDVADTNLDNVIQFFLNVPYKDSVREHIHEAVTEQRQKNTQLNLLTGTKMGYILSKKNIYYMLHGEVAIF